MHRIFFLRGWIAVLLCSQMALIMQASVTGLGIEGQLIRSLSVVYGEKPSGH
jgi:hypothetical protein